MNIQDTQHIFDEHDLVFGNWGEGIVVLKGERLLDRLKASGESKDCSTTTLFFADRREARACRDAFGDHGTVN